MKKQVITLILAAMLPVAAVAQEERNESSETAKKAGVAVSLGVGIGFHASQLNFSSMPSDFEADERPERSSVMDFYLQAEFGKSRVFALRPELTILNRGTRLQNMGGMPVCYRLTSHEVDFRLPFILNMGGAKAAVRPYVLAAPVLSLSTGGNVQIYEEGADASRSGYYIGLSTADYQPLNVAVAAGLGLKFRLQQGCYLTFEGTYELGLTSTFGKGETDGTARNIDRTFYPNASYEIEGTRKYRGLELKVGLSVAL